MHDDTINKCVCELEVQRKTMAGTNEVLACLVMWLGKKWKGRWCRANEEGGRAKDEGGRAKDEGGRERGEGGRGRGERRIKKNIDYEE